MQATVSRYDPASASGAVFTDTGIELAFGPEALTGTQVRFLRAGQRVRLETTGDGADQTITAVRFITLP